VIVSNASPLIVLLKINKLSILKELFEKATAKTNVDQQLHSKEKTSQNIRSLTYVFIVTTTIFIIAAAYLSAHAHRKAS
jgi:predicted nucleic acid-binding protein